MGGVKKEKIKSGVPDRIYCKVYHGEVHFSLVKKSGFVSYVPENKALALFLRAQLELL